MQEKGHGGETKGRTEQEGCVRESLGKERQRRNGIGRESRAIKGKEKERKVSQWKRRGGRGEEEGTLRTAKKGRGRNKGQGKERERR